MAFKIAGSMAFKDAAKKANPIILEPMMKVTVIVPEEYMGDVIGDLNSRRGQIQGMEDRAGAKQINARVPLSEMFATLMTFVQRLRVVVSTQWSRTVTSLFLSQLVSLSLAKELRKTN